jgi:polysaccharide export outer membrane protein
MKLMSLVPSGTPRPARFALGLFCALALLILGSRPAFAQAGPPAGTLQPGDTVRVSVWNRAELSGSLVVAGDGTLAHPLYSDLVVAGVPLDQVRSRVAETVGRYQTNPRIVVEPTFRVSVTGHVRRPGLLALPPETTLAQAVALAGGGTENARLSAVRLTRGGTEVPVDLTRPGAGLAGERIRSGDALFVPLRLNVFREYVAPASSIVAAAISVLTLVINARRASP